MATYKEMSVEEIKKGVEDQREALRLFRHRGAGSRSKNVREGRTIRKEIARMLTELRAKQISHTK